MKAKIILLSLSMLFLLAGCASMKNRWTPVGTWEYLVTNTPDGDASGTLIITMSKEEYAGVLHSTNYGDAEISNFLINEEHALSGSFNMAGYDFYLKGTFDGDTFTGQVESSIAEPFPMTAKRQIQ